MKALVNMPVVRATRRAHILFYENYFKFSSRNGFLFNEDISINLVDCESVINSFSAGDKNDENWIPVLTFLIEKNFPSLCLKLKRDKVKFIWGVRHWTTAGVKILDPSGNIISLTCMDDADENGVVLDDLDFLRVVL